MSNMTLLYFSKIYQKTSFHWWIIWFISLSIRDPTRMLVAFRSDTCSFPFACLVYLKLWGHFFLKILGFLGPDISSNHSLILSLLIGCGAFHGPFLPKSGLEKCLNSQASLQYIFLCLKEDTGKGSKIWAHLQEFWQWSLEPGLLWSQMDLNWNPALLLISCLTLDKLFDFPISPNSSSVKEI